MSYFGQDQEERDDSEAGGAAVFDSLLGEITRAEAELADISRQLKNQPAPSLQTELGALGQEVEVMAGEKVEGLPEDPDIRYYLAVGKLEKQLVEMRQAKEMSEQRMQSHAQTLEQLDFKIKEQKEVIARMEKLGEETTGSSETKEDVNLAERKELNNKVRANKILLRDFKKSLKLFIDMTAELDPEMSGQEGSPYGHLLQALWKNYLENGFEYLSIQDQDFDVPDSTLSHLVQAGIVKYHPSDKDRIKMEDFTCRD